MCFQRRFPCGSRVIYVLAFGPPLRCSVDAILHLIQCFTAHVFAQGTPLEKELCDTRYDSCLTLSPRTSRPRARCSLTPRGHMSVVELVLEPRHPLGRSASKDIPAVLSDISCKLASSNKVFVHAAVHPGEARVSIPEVRNHWEPSDSLHPESPLATCRAFEVCARFGRSER